MSYIRNPRKNTAALLLGGALLALCAGGAAHAQQTVGQATPTPEPEAAPSQSGDTLAPETQGESAPEDGSIVVTGSRIKNTIYTSTSPVTVLDTANAAQSGRVTAAEILQSTPIAASAGQVNNTYTGYLVGGGAGINTVSLRGLGDQRSLVLLNGRRLPPSGVGGSVGPIDLSVIPSSIVKRYEILKDGASSVYGSDAVAGVVNGITRTNVEGLDLTALGTTTHNGGAEAFSVSGTWGRSFSSGRISVAAEYYDQGRLTMAQRSNFSCPQHFFYKPDGSRADLIDPKTGSYKCYLNTTAEGSVYAYYPIEATGSPRLFDVYNIQPGAVNQNFGGFASVGGLAQISYDDPRQLSQTIFSPLQRGSVFVQGEYRPDWMDVQLYTELLYTTRKSEQVGFSVFRPFYARNSTLNPLRGAIVPGLEQYGEIGLIARPHVLYEVSSKQTVDVYRGVLGGKGSLFGWSYDAYVSHSLSKGRYSADAIYNDRVAFGTGTDQNDYSALAGGVCGVGAPAGCAPLNLFTKDALEDGKLSQQIRDYYFTRDQGRTSYSQTIVEISATGDLFKLPHGPLSGALGATMRRDAIDDQPGELSTTHNIWGRTTSGRTKGDGTVFEIFGELDAPIIRNVPMIEDLKLNISGRFSHYDSVGSAGTYKVGLNWAINNTLRVRATHGTSFRAPTLYELFLNDQRGFLEQSDVDPCVGYDQTDAGGNFLLTNDRIRTNCAAAGLPTGFVGGLNRVTVSASGGGNQLKPERSIASTVGIALTPPRSGLQVAVDYWRIEIKDQISNIGAGAVNACYNADDFPTSGYCNLFERNAVDFGVATIDTRYMNIPTERSSGIDFTGDYEHEFNAGTFTANLLASYILEHKIQPFSGNVVQEYVGMLGYPKLVGNYNMRFQRRNWTVAYSLNFTGASSNIGRYGETGKLNGGYANGATYSAAVDAFITHDLFFSYSAKTWQLLVGVRNFTGQQAPIVGEGVTFSRLGNYPFSSQYSDGYVGRRYLARVSKVF